MARGAEDELTDEERAAVTYRRSWPGYRGANDRLEQFRRPFLLPVVHRKT
jgi:hypothetical protein